MGNACCSTQQDVHNLTTAGSQMLAPQDSQIIRQRQREANLALESQFEEEQEQNLLIRLQARVRAALSRRRYGDFMQRAKALTEHQNNSEGQQDLVAHFGIAEVRETLGKVRVSIGVVANLVKDISSVELEKKTHRYACSGAIYRGTWFYGLRHGEGTMTWPDGASYSGIWSFGQASKYGKFTFKNGDIYEGCWSASKMSGYGVFRHADGTVYRGLWRQGQMHGKGLECWATGAQYLGDYRNGVKEGEGTFLWADGSRYYGQWYNNEIDGLGIVQWKDGRHYIGQWSQGDRSGYGRYVWSDGKKYEGNYLNDKRHGFGIYMLPDGRTYKGGYREDKQHGLASYSIINKQLSKDRAKVMYGVWEAGRRLKWFTIDQKVPVETQLGQIVAKQRDEHDLEEQIFYSFDEPEDFKSILDSVIANATALKEKLEHMRENGVDLHHAEDYPQENASASTMVTAPAHMLKPVRQKSLTQLIGDKQNKSGQGSIKLQSTGTFKGTQRSRTSRIQSIND